MSLRAAASIVLVLLVVRASGADELPAVPPADARIKGRIFTRGTINALPEATIQIASGNSVSTDQNGRFELPVPSGVVEVLITAEGHEPLRLTEKLAPGQGLEVEYRLLPQAAHRRRYEATVRGEARSEGQRFALRGDELRTLPGSLGDPFRTIGLLPGVATPLPVLPLYVIRGASPGMNGFFLDGMRVPQLFHLLVGGGVVHARLVDRIDFFPGGYDASFGRYAGGVIDAETRPARSDGYHGEMELRLYDISAAVELKLPKDVRITVSGHYGYPGPLINLIDNRVNLSYWDYQFRLDWRGLTIEALGSYDNVSIARSTITLGASRSVPDDFSLQFHRVQARYRGRKGRFDGEAAIVGGFDELSAFGGAGVRKLGLSWRAYARAAWKHFKLHLGTDGEVSRFSALNFAMADVGAQPDQFGDLAGNRDGVVAGAFIVGTVEVFDKRLALTLSGRIDVYHAGKVTLLGMDPRAQIRAKLLPQLSMHAGGGLYQQPPSFPVALPGIDTFALQLGLQSAIHGAVGLEAILPQSFTFGLTGFYQKYLHANDVVIDFAPLFCTSPPPDTLTGAPAAITRQVDGQSFGMEVLLRRKSGRVTGWIAYTLSRTERIFSCGLRPADYDQTHVLNTVVQVRLPWRLVLGGRLFVQTGRPVTILEPPDGRSTVRNNTRLPTYVQVDLRLDREWLFKKWAFAAFLEIVNLTYSQVNFGLTYPELDGLTRYDQPRLNGFRWILPSLGLRGRF